ncbi:hypothetical protein ACGFRB_24075 [Streptomyces sp. NPDC048718]|uniref:hypothetical protein n=1 Tax=Streptomyces sp. NPDC048718 TaxID=3365587 RepID=UPI003722D54F
MEVSRRLRITADTVRTWRRRFLERGLIVLLRDDRDDCASVQTGAVGSGGVGIVGGHRARPGARAAGRRQPYAQDPRQLLASVRVTTCAWKGRSPLRHIQLA